MADEKKVNWDSDKRRKLTKENVEHIMELAGKGVSTYVISQLYAVNESTIRNYTDEKRRLYKQEWWKKNYGRYKKPKEDK